MPQRRTMPPFLAQNWKAQTNRLSSQGLVAQTTGSFKNRTNHVSFPLRITLGIAYLMFFTAKGYLCHLPVLQEVGNCIGIDVTKPHRIWSCCVRNFPPCPSGSRGLKFWNPVEPFQCSVRPILIKMSLVVCVFFRRVVDGALGLPRDVNVLQRCW